MYGTMLQRGKSVSNHVYRDNAGYAKISRAGHVLLSQQKHNLKLIFPVVREESRTSNVDRVVSSCRSEHVMRIIFRSHDVLTST